MKTEQLFINFKDSFRSLSYTKLKTFNENKYDFYVKYYIKLPSQKNISNSNESGIVIHNIVSELIIKFSNFKTKNPTEIEINNAIDEIMDQNASIYDDKLLHLIVNSSKSKIIKTIQILFNKLEEKSLIFVEKEISTEINLNGFNIKFNCRPDILITHHNSFEIYDIKTGSSQIKSETIKKNTSYESPQLLFYSLINSKTTKTQTKNLGYFYLSYKSEESKLFNSFIDENIDPQLELEKYQNYLINMLSDLQKINLIPILNSDIEASKHKFFSRINLSIE